MTKPSPFWIRATCARQPEKRGAPSGGRPARLVLERTGRETTETWEISTSLSWLTLEDDSFCSLDHGYSTAWAFLYGDCYIDNHCEPEDYHAELIRETADYIRDAERLA